jgi:uncharacterized membrane protein
MPTLEVWTLWLHIAAGVVALFTGGGALVTTKGGLWHRRAGKLFVASMAVVVGSVIPLLAFEPTPSRRFLTLVAIFSGYLAFSGYRALPRNRSGDRGRLVDWTAAGTVILACVGLGSWGLTQLLDGESFGLVMVVFGGIGLAFGVIDLRTFWVTDRREEWMVTHLQRMVGAVIATVSAVSAVNLTGTLGVAAWLWPTAVGVPLIAYWSREYGS